MVYKQHLVACIKVNGQVLRESGDTVTIPFGSEYTVLLKNLNSVRVQVKVHVDGTDATEGTWLVIAPNSSIELERYIRNGNMSQGNRFKFIPLTKSVETHRGIKVDDGLIRIEYKTEKVVKTQDVHITRYVDHWIHRPYYAPWHNPFYYYTTYGPDTYVFNKCVDTTTFAGDSSVGDNVNLNNGGISFQSTSGVTSGAQMGQTNGVMAMNVSLASGTTPQHPGAASPLRSARNSRVRTSRPERSFRSKAAAEPVDESGITVPGSESNQQFHASSWFQVHEVSEVLVLRLRGRVGDEPVVKAVTVKTKATCVTCGKKSKGDKKFCGECGTSLTLV